MPSELLAPPSQIHVPVAGFAVAREHGILSTVGLGSCVAIILYDPRARIGALAHALLPSEAMSRDRTRPAKFASTAVPFLLDELKAVGSGSLLTVRLVGGASMFGALLKSSGVNMGERNVEAARAAVRAASLRVTAEDVGGDFGRSVYFDVATGVVRVVSMRYGERAL